MSDIKLYSTFGFSEYHCAFQKSRINAHSLLKNVGGDKHCDSVRIVAAV